MATSGPGEFETSLRLFGPASITATTSGTAQTLYTCPAGKKAKLKVLHIANVSAATRDITVSIGVDAVGTRLIPTISLAKNTILDLQTEIVLSAGETIRAFASAANDITITIGGSEIPV